MQKKQTDDRMKYIYSEHKKGRSYTDIGRELGITAARVGQYYRRMDFRLNGYKADHFHPLYKASGKVARNLPIRDGTHIREYHLPSETKKEQELDYNQEKQYVTAIWENIVYEKSLDRKSFSDFQRRVDILRNFAQKHSWDLEIDADDGTPGIVRLYGSSFSADNRDLMPIIFYSNVNASRPEESMMIKLLRDADQFAVRAVEYKGKPALEIELVYDLYTTPVSSRNERIGCLPEYTPKC